MLKQKLITLDKPPLLIGNDIEQKRAELRAYFEQTWELYESLFSLINQDEAFLLRPEPLRHPLIFYFGHTATFYINKLRIDNDKESCYVNKDNAPDNFQKIENLYKKEKSFSESNH